METLAKASHLASLRNAPAAATAFAELLQYMDRHPGIVLPEAYLVGHVGRFVTFLMTSQLPEALAELRAAVLRELPVERIEMLSSMLVDVVAARRLEREVLAALRDAPAARQLEPLVVALKMIVGEEYQAPLEVAEVAKDVVKRIEQLRARPSPGPAPSTESTPIPDQPAGTDSGTIPHS